MTKITLTDLVNLQNETTAVNAINNNNATIVVEFDNTLSRDGSQPNTMNAALDMNSNAIVNLPNPVSNTSPLRLQDLNTFIGGGTISTIPSGGTTNQVLAKKTNTNYDTQWVTGGTVNSVGLSLPADFTVTNSPVTSTGTLTGAWVTPPTGTGGVVRSTSPNLTSPSFSSISNSGTITLPSTTDTLVGRATTDTLTGKTFDTAGSGNVLRINGTQITANTGTGPNVLATSPTITGATLTTSSVNGVTLGGVGQYPGTATNDNASAGNIGEYISSQVLVGSSIALTTAVSANITSISLTAGDWDVWGIVATSPAGSTTQSAIYGWLSTTSATLPTVPNNGGFVGFNIPIAAGLSQVLSAGKMRLSLSSTTTVYLSMQVAFATSTCNGYGFIGARRAR